MKKIIHSAAVVGATTLAAVLMSAGPAVAGHEHLVKITNPHTGQVTCQYIGRGATPTNDNFHDRAHTGSGQARRGDRAYIEKEGSAQAGTCDEVRGQQTAEVEPH
jgi:hypothetical protein